MRELFDSNCSRNHSRSLKPQDLWPSVWIAADPLVRCPSSFSSPGRTKNWPLHFRNFVFHVYLLQTFITPSKLSWFTLSSGRFFSSSHLRISASQGLTPVSKYVLEMISLSDFRLIFNASLVFVFHPLLEGGVLYPRFMVRVLPDWQDLVHENAKGPHITPGNKMKMVPPSFWTMLNNSKVGSQMR